MFSIYNQFTSFSYIITHYSMIPDYEDVPSDEEKIDIRNFNGKHDTEMNLNGWNQILLKDQVKKAIREVGFQFPSEVQRQTIPVIMQGRDIMCQARSGMGKTAVFIIGVLNQLAIVNDQYIPFNCIVLCHTRELAHQIFKDFRRFGRYYTKPELRISCFFGGLPTNNHREELNTKPKPHIVIGTPGRLAVLIRENLIPLNKVSYFIIDECDQILGSDMRKDLRNMCLKMTHSKQMLMFSATMPQNLLNYAKEFMNNEVYISVDSGKLILDGLSQFNIYLLQKQKVERVITILDGVGFNQAVIFVNKVERAKKLTNLLRQKLFNPVCIHSNLTQAQRLVNYDNFKKGQNSRLLIATDLFGRGIDIERVNLVVNYDLPLSKDIYLHRVGRAGRFNTRGIAINFVCKIGDQEQQDAKIKDIKLMEEIQQGLHNPIPQLPQKFDSKNYI